MEAKYVLFFSILLMNLRLEAKIAYPPKKTTIACKIAGLGSSNSLVLRIDSDVYGGYAADNVDFMENADKNKLAQQNTYTLKNDRDGYFTFSIRLPAAKYAVIYSSLRAPNSKIIDIPMLIDPGDSITIAEKEGRLEFAGRNAAKYSVAYELYRIRRNPIIYSAKESPELLPQWFGQLDSLAERSFQVLDSFKPELSSKDYWLQKSDIICNYQEDKFGYLKWRGSLVQPENNKYFPYLKDYRSPLWNAGSYHELLSHQTVLHSLRFMDFIIEEYKYDSCFMLQQNYNNRACYSYLKSSYQGQRQDRLIYEFVNNNFLHYRQDLGYCMSDALSFIGNASVRKRFRSWLKTYAVGSPATGFALKDLNGHTVHLSDFRGKVVLMDFWFIGCGACARLHPFLDSIKQLLDPKDFVLLSICLDYSGKSKEEWPAAVASNKYTSIDNINLFAPGENNKDPEIAKNYNVTGCPTLILVCRDGKLSETPLVDPSGSYLLNFIKARI